MLTEKMEKALNDQLHAELFSAYLYLSMSAHFQSANLSGFSSWMEVQAQEELAHMMKFYHFIHERGGRVTLQAVDAPQAEWDSPLDAFEGAFKHEQYITGRINDLVNLAMEEKDHATNNFLQWFVAEQVEEEASADEVVQRLRLIGDSGHGIFMLDREMGARTFTPPSEGE